MKLREYSFIGLTQALCPECMEVVPAKIVERGGRVYFHKSCRTHGSREDFVCSDVRYFDQLQFSVPGRVPEKVGAPVDRGCPHDCGLCDQHEQHTCIGLVELTDDCNLRCPTCYAGSGPGGHHRSFEEIKSAIDRLVETEGEAEVLQLSGGEPTLHPEFERILRYACDHPHIQLVMVNTNGLRIARDDGLLELLEEVNRQVEIYLQLDGLSERSSRALRGASLVENKRSALERLGQADVRVTLVCTLEAGVNEDQIGPLVELGAQTRHVAGVSFQPTTYSGRHVAPDELEQRITFPDVVKALAEQTSWLAEDDFMPLPCAHPNCHTLTYAYRRNGKLTPLLRMIDARQHTELLANGIAYTRPRAKQLVEQYLQKTGCIEDGGSCGDALQRAIDAAARQSAAPDEARAFFSDAVSQRLDPENVFRITITSFLDAYNFDLRRLMKCCIHHVLPSGHVVPFCAYNVLYRPGHVQLPSLRDGGGAEAPVGPDEQPLVRLRRAGSEG